VAVNSDLIYDRSAGTSRSTAARAKRAEACASSGCTAASADPRDLFLEPAEDEARRAAEDTYTDGFGRRFCPRLCRSMDFDHRLALEHTIAAGQLPGPHRDPWNRVALARACGTASRVLMLDPVFATIAYRPIGERSSPGALG
jgi:hypothetical protein